MFETMLLGSVLHPQSVIAVTLPAARVPFLRAIPTSRFAEHMAGKAFLMEVAQKIGIVEEKISTYAPLPKSIEHVLLLRRASNEQYARAVRVTSVSLS